MTTNRRKIARLVVGCLLAVAAFAAYHFYLRDLMLDTGLRLGAVRPGKKVYRIVPLYIYWRPRLKTGVLIAAAVLGGFVWWLRRGPRPSGCLQFVVALMTWHVAIAVSVALIDGGPQKLWDPYTVHRRSDYIGAVEAIHTPRAFLYDYRRLMPDLALHCRTHPPGGPLLLWAIAQLFGRGAFAASMVTILLSSLAAPAVYLLARDLLDEVPARLAAGFFVLAPSVACYSATCMDAVFMVPLVWSFFFVWHGSNGRPLVWGVAGGVSGWVAAMMTFSTSFVALWALVLLMVTLFFDRPRRRGMLLMLATAVATSVICFGLLYAWSGYDPLAVLRQAFVNQDEEMQGRGHSSLRQSLHFAVTNLIAFLFCAGLPAALGWLRQSAREIKPSTATAARWPLVSFGVAFFLFDVAPLYTIETERLWMFLVGFLAIGAAAQLDQEAGSIASSPLVTTALLLQAGQTILMEVLFDWVW